MKMDGEYRIPAPRNDVWIALNDVETLKRSLPGCDRLERTGESTLSGSMTTKVGPVKVGFRCDITLSDVNPPRGYRISGEGKAGPAGYARGGASVDLKENDGETLLTYSVDAALSGKLAQIGSRVVNATAKKLADEFFRAIAGELAGGASKYQAGDPRPASAS